MQFSGKFACVRLRVCVPTIDSNVHSLPFFLWKLSGLYFSAFALNLVTLTFFVANWLIKKHTLSKDLLKTPNGEMGLMLGGV